MTNRMLEYLLSEGLAEVANGRLRLTPYGIGTMLHLRWLRDHGGVS